MRKSLVIALAVLSLLLAPAVAGPSQAVASTSITVVAPPPPKNILPSLNGLNPDPLHRRGKLIEISIRHQRLRAWNNGRVYLSTLVSTGMPGYDTPRGHFHVISKGRQVFSYPYHVWMPWAMNFHGNYFVHGLAHYPGATWSIGGSMLGHRASHGCVRVGLGPVRVLYYWARVGTPVWVH